MFIVNSSKTIYFIHSTSFDFKNEYYDPIQRSQLSRLHKLIFPHAKSDVPFASKMLFESGKCDLVVAEVSFPSTGGGIEIGWANMKDIPIIMVAQRNSQVSDYLKDLCQSFIIYKDRSDLVEKLKIEISNLDNK